MMTFREQWKTLVWPVFSVCYGADYNSEFCSIYPSNIRWMFISHFRLFSHCVFSVHHRFLSGGFPDGNLGHICWAEWHPSPIGSRINFYCMALNGIAQSAALFHTTKNTTLLYTCWSEVRRTLFDLCLVNGCLWICLTHAPSNGPHEHSVERALAFSALWM